MKKIGGKMGKTQRFHGSRHFTGFACSNMFREIFT